LSTRVKGTRALATLVAQLSSYLDGEHSFITERAHRHISCCRNLKVTSWRILDAT